MGDSGLDAVAGEADLLAALMASFRKELDSILCSAMEDLLSSEEEENPVEGEELLVMSLLLLSMASFSSFSLLLSSLEGWFSGVVRFQGITFESSAKECKAFPVCTWTWVGLKHCQPCSIWIPGPVIFCRIGLDTHLKVNLSKVHEQMGHPVDTQHYRRMACLNVWFSDDDPLVTTSLNKKDAGLFSEDGDWLLLLTGFVMVVE